MIASSDERTGREWAYRERRERIVKKALDRYYEVADALAKVSERGDGSNRGTG